MMSAGAMSDDPQQAGAQAAGIERDVDGGRDAQRVRAAGRCRTARSSHPGTGPRSSAERMNMFTYSAKKKKPKRMPLYSVAKPATISLSASVRSNGVRLASAVAAMKKMSAASGCRKMYQSRKLPCWSLTIWVRFRVPVDHHDAHHAQDERQLVADEPCRGPQPTEQRVLVEAGPAGHHQAHHAQATDREEVQQPDVHGEAVQAGRERDHQQRHHRGEVDHRGCQREHRHVRAGGREVLLGQHLEAVDDRGERPPGSDPVGARRAGSRTRSASSRRRCS